MARVYTLRRDERKLDRIVVRYLYESGGITHPDHTDLAPFVSEVLFRKQSVHKHPHEDWRDAVQEVIRGVARNAMELKLSPSKLIIHVAHETLPKVFRAWLYQYEVEDNEEAPFFTKIVLHEHLGETWAITGRYNL